MNQTKKESNIKPIDAIDELVKFKDSLDTRSESLLIELVDIAINAIKKQIPMKMPGTYTDYKCAVCGRRIRSGKGSSSYKSRDNFCQRCGQAVDWGD